MILKTLSCSFLFSLCIPFELLLSPDEIELYVLGNIFLAIAVSVIVLCAGLTGVLCAAGADVQCAEFTDVSRAV